MRRHLPAFSITLSAAIKTPHRPRRPRAECACSRRTGVRIALLVFNLFEVETETIGEHLAKYRLVPLPVVMRSHDEHHRSGRIEANLRPFGPTACGLLRHI